MLFFQMMIVLSNIIISSIINISNNVELFPNFDWRILEYRSESANFPFLSINLTLSIFEIRI